MSASVASSLLPVLHRERSNTWQLNKILAKQADADAIFHALEALGRDPAAKLDVIAYTIGISACARSAQYQKSCRLLELMLQAGVKADVPSFNAAITSCQKDLLWRTAFGLLQQMLVTNVEPNSLSFSTAINSCDGKNWQRAASLHLAMAKAKLQPNIYSFNAAISSSEKSSLWWQALDVLTTAPKLPVQRNVVNFNATICACNQPLVDKKDLWKMGVGLLDTIMSTDLQPSVISYSTMASEAPWELSFACLESMAWSSIESNAFSFSTAVSTGELWQVSLQLLQDMPQQQLEPNLVCYNALISRLGWRHAMGFLGALPTATVLPDDVSCSATMAGCEKGGQWTRALSIFEPSEATASSCSSALAACTGGFQWQLACHALVPLLRDRLQPNTVCFNAAISCVQNWEEALSLLDLMEEKGLQPDLLTFNSVMHACQMAEAWQVAFHILSAMRESQVKPGADSYDIAMRRWSL